MLSVPILQGCKVIQRVPALHAFWDFEKTVFHEIRVGGIIVNPPSNAKIPHLHVHKPKTVVLETVLVIFVKMGDPLLFTFGDIYFKYLFFFQCNCCLSGLVSLLIYSVNAQIAEDISIALL